MYIKHKISGETNLNTTRKRVASFLSLMILLLAVYFATRFEQTTIATWGVQKNDTFTYIIEDTNWLINLDGYSQDGYGATFKTLEFNDKSSFNLQVLSVDENWGVEFRINNSTESTTGTISEDEFKFEILNRIYYSIYECKRIVTEGFNAKEIQQGPELLDWFFIQPETRTWNYLSNLSSVSFHNNLPRTNDISGTFVAEFTHDNSEAMFDLLLDGSIENKTLDTKIQFEHTMKFVWNGTTGVLLGYRFSAYFQGTYEGHVLSEQITVVMRLKGYILPKFKFFTGFIPGFSFSMSIATFLVIVSFWLIHRKRKKRTKS